nr:hypothetical protein SAML2008_23420 [Salmonella enterica]
MKTQTTHAAEQHAAKRRWLNAHEEGYHKAMGNRQVQMIAIGGAIGTGLFLGAGARLQMAGPALALVYLICGIFSFFILRALGELVLHRPSSGSFVSYAREFLGEKAAYVAGWMYFIPKCAIPVIIGFGRGTMGGVGYFSRIIKRATIKSKIVIPHETCVILNQGR